MSFDQIVLTLEKPCYERVIQLLIGYARLSKQDQHLQLQKGALNVAVCKSIL